MPITETKIEKCEIKKTAAGKDFASLTFKNKDGITSTTCKIWEEDLSKIPLVNLRTGNLIKADVINNPKYGWTIKSVELLKLAPIGLDEKQRQWLYREITCMLCVDGLEAEQKEDEKRLTEIFIEIISSLSYYKDHLLICPAAKDHHHNYIGGLLQHTYEIIMFIERHKKYLSNVEYLECIASATIHDLGKIFEYEIDTESGVITYREGFKESLNLAKYSKIAPHIYWIHNWAIERGFKEIAHIVGSHHNSEEWGSMFQPNNNAAQMLFQADYFSSRFGLLHVDDFDKPHNKLMYEYFILESDENIGINATITQTENTEIVNDGEGLEMETSL